MELSDFYKNFIPEDFLKAPGELITLLEKPVVIHLTGRNSDSTVCVSGMLHGTERCGFYAILRELKRAIGKAEAIAGKIDASGIYLNDVIFIIGNVKAAKQNPLFSNRVLPGQKNYNRIWGVNNPQCPDQSWAWEVENYLRENKIKAMIDIHSFTGINPPHTYIAASGNMLAHCRELASLFSEYVLEMSCSLQGGNTLIGSISDLCPACVVECGRNNTEEADEYASFVLEKFLSCTGTAIYEKEFKSFSSRYFHLMKNIRVKDNLKITFADAYSEQSDLILCSDFEKINFQNISKGRVIGFTSLKEVPFLCLDENGNDTAGDIFGINGKKEIFLKKDIFPALTKNDEKLLLKEGFYLFEEQR